MGYFGMLDPTTKVGKLTMASSLSKLHSSKMTTKLNKYQVNMESNVLRMPNWYKSTQNLTVCLH